jgi:hypothetical protein
MRVSYRVNKICRFLESWSLIREQGKEHGGAARYRAVRHGTREPKLGMKVHIHEW